MFQIYTQDLYPKYQRPYDENFQYVQNEWKILKEIFMVYK